MPARSAAIRLALTTLILAAWAQAATAAFRVAPYVQNPTETTATLVWFSDSPNPGEVTLGLDDGPYLRSLRSEPRRADALAYQPGEMESPPALPYHHELRIGGLQPGRAYRYTVRQDGETAHGRIATRPEEARALRFIVFGDSETEPESVGKFTPWQGRAPGEEERLYLVDQELGFRENLRVMQSRKPDFVAIAGDLVEAGGEQRDWDEFWRLAGPLAASTPIFPALGNHDYWAGPGERGQYAEVASERAVAKYRSHFDLPANGMGPHHERYYSVDWGPVTLIVLDLNNGVPQGTAADTNWYMRGEGEGGFAPSWAPGSAQYRWLEASLRRAQRDSAFTFVMFHFCPYSSGPHGLPPGDGAGEDRLSGVPLRALTPLFQRYGVDALFNGHDELYEHSVVPGTQVLPDGASVAHRLHVYDVGVGGDGLRAPVEGLENPYRVFVAHDDAPEVRDDNGLLIDGGKHYGHLEVNVVADGQGGWDARLDMVYLFPVMDASGRVLRFERRLYDDSLVLSAPKP